ALKHLLETYALNAEMIAHVGNLRSARLQFLFRNYCPRNGTSARNYPGIGNRIAASQLLGTDELLEMWNGEDSRHKRHILRCGWHENALIGLQPVQEML